MSLAVPLALRRELDALDLDVRLRSPGASCDDLVERARDLRAEAQRAGIAVVAGVAALREGELLVEAGQAPRAIAALDAAAGELSATGSTDLATAALARLSDALVAVGDLRRALTVCAEGIDVVERDRYKTSAPYLQAGYLRRTIALYANGVRAAVELGDRRALEWVELSKSRVLPGASNRGGGRAGAAATELLEARLAELGQRIDRSAERGHDTAALRGQRRAVFDELVVTERRSTRLPEFDLAQVHARLDGGQIAVSYYWLDPARLLISVVGRTGTHLHVQPVTAEDRAELDTLAATVLGAPGAVAHRVHSATIDRCLDRLAAVLVPPAVRVAITGAARLLVAPHRSLHVVPFGAVPIDGQPLVRHAAVAVVPNLTALQLPPPTPRTPRLLAVGAAEYVTGGPHGAPPKPLPQAEPEVEDVARAYAERGISADVLAGAAVTEVALERRCAVGDAGPTCLHLALHGASVESDTPLESWLLLPRSRLDGIDLVRWRLPGATVVLSACCSGQRAIGARGMQELPGDDLFGLQTAFFAAGARQVLGALWPVHDRVARSLTTAFHDELLSGAPADVALQRAVIAHLDTAGVLHRQVGYWAPFFLSCIGTPTALETPP